MSPQRSPRGKGPGLLERRMGELARAPFSISYRAGRWGLGGSQERAYGLALSLEGHCEGAGGNIPAEPQTVPKVRGLEQPFDFAAGAGTWERLRWVRSSLTRMASAEVAGIEIPLQLLTPCV